MSSTCVAGVFDCASPLADPDTCAPYNDAYISQEHNLGLLVVASMVAAFMCFTIGANDSANAWGSTVGSGAVPLSVAVTLGGFGEWLGATLLGYGVSDTIKKGVADTTDPDCWACGYCDSGMAVYAVGMLCALLAAALFLLLATFAAMPVSTTHAIVAGVVGMTMVGSAEMDGVACLNWAWSGGLTSIVASWAISPLFSGAVAFAIFRATKFAALDAARPGSAALLLSPFLYSTAAWVMTFLIMLKSQPTKQIERSTQALTACVVAGLTHAYASLLAPRVREAMPTVRALRAEQEQSHRAVRELSARLVRLEAAYRSLEQAHSARKPPSAGLLGALRERIGADDPAASPSPRCAPEPGAEVLEVRRELSLVDSLASKHADMLRAMALQPQATPPAAMGGGGLRTSGLDEEGGEAGEAGESAEDAVHVFRYVVVFANSTSAFSAVYTAFSSDMAECDSTATPWWVMSVAGAFVALGVVTLGYRVIQTLGSDIAEIDFHMAFCVESASTVTVVVATCLGLPISSTHCQVGAIVFVGMAKHGLHGSDCALFGKIALTWVATIPLAAAIAALMMLPARAAITL
ncbi:putative inorganic phosphate transporter [Emiliania huxleyi CCMP1516]|uniref:Phosphate transporter n=3 Tax=Emiliania huxleyi TaxID=2903 RepID=A0A0D3IJK1_EMIH1|nr:putative inorganic phosphate transporter [Emiliania huxleyi CCMP1516]EOD11436.1 putative inorganic phosphate transporter [Emiliania huxleyi CCMP1516]|eukprot:XP_005763865.1 putative inorganic phosphate transporter [Emiliania huxleyi CCMP1516]